MNQEEKWECKKERKRMWCILMYLIAMYIVSICFFQLKFCTWTQIILKLLLLSLFSFSFFLSNIIWMCKILVPFNGRKQFERSKQIEKLTLQKILNTCMYVCLWVGEPEKFLCWIVRSFCKTIVKISSVFLSTPFAYVLMQEQIVHR